MEGPHHLPTMPWPSQQQEVEAVSLPGLLQTSQVVSCADGGSFAMFSVLNSLGQIAPGFGPSAGWHSQKELCTSGAL